VRELQREAAEADDRARHARRLAMDESADTVEALRSEVRGLKSALEDERDSRSVAEAEARRLRAALRELQDASKSGAGAMVKDEGCRQISIQTEEQWPTLPDEPDQEPPPPD